MSVFEFEGDTLKEKLDFVLTAIRYGKFYCGFNKKPMLYIGSCWHDGYHFVIHLGWIYISWEY